MSTIFERQFHLSDTILRLSVELILAKTSPRCMPAINRCRTIDVRTRLAAIVVEQTVVITFCSFWGEASSSSSYFCCLYFRSMNLFSVNNMGCICQLTLQENWWFSIELLGLISFFTVSKSLIYRLAMRWRNLIGICLSDIQFIS